MLTRTGASSTAKARVSPSIAQQILAAKDQPGPGLAPATPDVSSLLLRKAHFPLCPPLIQTHPSPYKDDSESLSMFDTRLLSGVSVMIAVVEAGSFVWAADVLGLTPSGVSRAIARLETRIGIRLFDRNPRAVVVTVECRRC